ncbi:aminotransferase class V-fold PLP-dependent enzyme [Mesorhizobium sp. CGMCC 1.15528]|uniref:Aminotransferase class V-fold PLP-dependent enzyme n=1 Tax=Mesorhizobium zhangyense TaxID=1776730 RepID=A0A7C9VIS8_9HYPH|nr:aminotransferase class V-fold PLP-dependent enzyme [Mesorhizobium zhangyense]NGN45291.1 aminotransferase class V-fold PLP-dependent enzyme [Mesorhizobium zhangyense]
MTIDIDKILRDFPYLDEVLYLNTASTGISWRGQGAAAARFYDGMQSRGFDGRDDWRALAGRVQLQLSKLLSVEPDEIGFVGSTTEALNLVTQAMPVKSGDQIVFAADEFPSLRQAMDALQARGATLCPVDITDEEQRTDILCNAVPGARVVGMSHVHWHSGTKVDLGRISEACRREGADLIVDGIQALGATPVDASSCQVYAASVFKWLLSGFGLGIVVISRDFRRKLTPLSRGYANPVPSNDIRYGHINYPGLAAFGATLDFLEGIGWSAIMERTAMLRDRLIAGLNDAGVAIATPPNAAAGIVSARARDAETLVVRLQERKVRVEARGNLVRISPHFYNTESEIDRFCEIFAELGAKSS